MSERAAGFISGSPSSTEGRLSDVVNPFTGELLGHAVEADASIVDEAVRAAQRASADWAERSAHERGEVLLRAADLIEAEGEPIALAVTAEMGMPISLSRVSQWQLSATLLRTAAQQASTFPWVQQIDGATLHRRPSGVVAAISPWNMPSYQIMAKTAAALIAGCTLVVKPSVQTPFDAEILVRLLHRAGVPDGVVNLVQGPGSRTGALLSAHPGVSHVSFTGSVEAGKTVAGLAAGSLARCTLELGGKSPAIILPGADLAAAVPAALASGLVNSGQACNAASRLIVPLECRGEVEEILADAAAQFTIGDPQDESTQLGPLSSHAHGESVLGHIRGSLADGGRLIAGTGERHRHDSAGFFIAPTVITDLPRRAAAVQEEIFGPVIVLQTYQDVDEAVEVAHDTVFGLSAETWGPQEEAIRVATRLHVGQVKVNGVRTRDRPGVPFGGVGQSGYGRELGMTGIEEFTDLTAVMS